MSAVTPHPPVHSSCACAIRWTFQHTPQGWQLMCHLTCADAGHCIGLLAAAGWLCMLWGTRGSNHGSHTDLLIPATKWGLYAMAVSFCLSVCWSVTCKAYLSGTGWLAQQCCQLCQSWAAVLNAAGPVRPVSDILTASAI